MGIFIQPKLLLSFLRRNSRRRGLLNRIPLKTVYLRRPSLERMGNDISNSPSVRIREQFANTGHSILRGRHRSRPMRERSLQHRIQGVHNRAARLPPRQRNAGESIRVRDERASG